jgi:BirA family biotin operon repressor/biotin-[acetyl-CoA-carboxylase] ligase
MEFTMNTETLRQALGQRPFRYFTSTISTMLDAQRWLSERAPDGAVVIADEQTQGKGRLRRGWITPPGSSIAMSVILRGHTHPGQATMLGAVAAAEALDAYVSTNLKWPNDVQIAGKKVCGVLAESVWDSKGLAGIVLGIGINIALDFSGTELAEKATSLADHADCAIERPELIAALLDRVDHWRAVLQTHSSSQYGGLTDSPLFQAWKARLVTLGQSVTVQNQAAAFSGIAVDVDSDGALLIDLGGQVQRFLAGDVTLNPKGF